MTRAGTATIAALARRTPQRRVAVVTLLLVAAAVLALALTHVARRHEIVRLGYELSEATDELRAAQREHRRLKVERSLLRHPDRIERLARGLGMTRPEPGQIRVVHGDHQLADAARGARR